MTASTTTRTGLALSDVTLTFGDGDSQVVALDHVDLTVTPGEIVAVVGPSGAGKSSLLAVAGGLTRPTSGSVVVGGSDLTELSGAALARFRRDNVGFVFQSGNLVPALTAIDQLRLVEKITGRRAATPPEKLLAAVGMADHAKRRPGRLSGGERQRVGIARALVASPSVLLVDEPTAALDRRRSHEIVELLARQTHEFGVATVMVTHDHDVLEHCDRVLEMVDGRLGAV
ncbi:ABC transporter ATP-binding protein [Cellulomonas xiejunii]|uniref:ABC transporter ATP-binding protein n=1 Tax=Cellulomonas xiejunii TaxID=2968083 RepID=A0ABY5KME6_9CELL|nr:ABC transporter ATP-binding protein [Cellulomonas xiejunii]MCC2321089.1 ABC transporter ATP-binding protein [Cellulomonas xiejunii]UUI71682.1 ABC transporter ATP-binding protein [Cellulomonas xiejunii]